MARYTPREDMYNKMPLAANDNRDEHILVDVLGNWIPECDLIYYGLLNSEYSEKLYKLKNTSLFNTHRTYLETCFFSGDDLIRYLASPDDTLESLSEDFIKDAIATALSKYMYVPCNETMIRHSIIELSYYKFVKSVTLLFPWSVREIDNNYLSSIIPDTVLGKFKVASGDMLGFLKSKADSPTKYTTIVCNSLDNVNTMIDECDTYKTDEAFFILRNHSGNVSYTISQDENGKKIIDFNEIGTYEVLEKLMDIENAIPKTKMRFARYEPTLFKDSDPELKDFMLGK